MGLSYSVMPNLKAIRHGLIASPLLNDAQIYLTNLCYFQENIPLPSFVSNLFMTLG